MVKVMFNVPFRSRNGTWTDRDTDTVLNTTRQHAQHHETAKKNVSFMDGPMPH